VEGAHTQAEAAANAPPKRAPGRPLPKPHPDGASKLWWQPALILPILREVLRQNFATAVGALAYRFPTIYGALAPTKPLSEVTVRLWFEPAGSYSVLLPNYREALERGTGPYRPAAAGVAVQEQMAALVGVI
jgi:hypothetical protein